MTAGEIVETADVEAVRAATQVGDPRSELERLRDRVAELEANLVELSARSNAAVAEAQAQTYWLERWHVDLNELMRRPGAEELRIVLRAVRSVGRSVRRLKRRLRS
ncbi:MAG TPA: hypothetical protein VG165_16445 [Solirubrobacteraceae bacterium]|jgi:methyl coenzyme M reductase subunit C-like uncharacterized protein (methanogenesis marker protein 7)|nr:hypothetical protein [Solirubrobacteraceae bacterium]